MKHVSDTDPVSFVSGYDVSGKDLHAAGSARTQPTKLGVLLSAGMSKLSGSARRLRTRMTLRAGPHIRRPSRRLGPLPLWKPHCVVTRCGPYT